MLKFLQKLDAQIAKVSLKWKISLSLDEFRKSMVTIGESSDQLSTKVFWLNVVLAVATLIGTVATVTQFLN